MSRIAYVNGRYRPKAEPLIQVEDRGLQFSDGVYEVWGVRGGVLVDAEAHLARLARSLRELRIGPPMSNAALTHVVYECMRRNRLRDGIVYLQINRGAALRDHAFPPPGTPATIILTCRPLNWAQQEAQAQAGVGVLFTPDLRWRRRDIKSVSLLPNVLAKQAAREAGAFEAWLVDAHGFVTEGASTNAWIVDKAGVLRTRPLSNDILAGVTRANVMKRALESGLALEERAFSTEETFEAREAFLSSATSFVTPVVRIDGCPIGAGAPGPIATRLRRAILSSG
jgi:D-alanine transaminase